MKPRNHVVLALLKRKAGVHVKSSKAIRRNDKVKLLKGLD